MSEILAYGLRVAIMFTMVYWVLRVSGKKTISAMTAVEVVGVLIIAAMAAGPLVTNSAIKTIYGIGLVVALELAFNRLGLVNRLQPFVQQQPTVLIRQGQVDRTALRQVGMSLEQLLSELRLKNAAGFAEVEYAILEPSGQVSVIHKADARPVKPRDLHLPVPYEGLSLPLVLDGEVIRANLRYAGRDEAWLRECLRQQGYGEPGQVFLAELDVQGQLKVQAQPGRGGPFYGTGPGAGWRPPYAASPGPEAPPAGPAPPHPPDRGPAH